MRKCNMQIPLIVLLLSLFVGCSQRQEHEKVDLPVDLPSSESEVAEAPDSVSVPTELPDSAYIERLFFVDGALYTIRCADAVYINHESSDPSVCYRLVERSGGRNSDIVCHISSGRLYYSDGHQIYSSDLTGNEKVLVWEFPQKSEEDLVNIMAVTDDCLLVCGTYWCEDRFSNSDYYSVDIGTGKTVKLLGDVSPYFKPLVLCGYENTVLLVQSEGKAGRVLSYDMLTGEGKELGRFDHAEETPMRDADGTILNDTLHFVCENDGIYSVPLSGGEVEYHRPDTHLIPGMKQIMGVEVYDGELYILLTGETEKQPYNTALCRWDSMTDTLYLIVKTQCTFPSNGTFLHDGKYYCTLDTKIRSREIVPQEPSQYSSLNDNPNVYTYTAADNETPEAVAQKLATIYMDDMMQPSGERTFRLTNYRNLRVELVVPTEKVDTNTAYQYFLRDSEISENTWLVEFEAAFQYEGIVDPIGNMPKADVGKGEPEIWITPLYTGSRVGFLMTKDGDQYTLQSRA